MNNSHIMAYNAILDNVIRAMNGANNDLKTLAAKANADDQFSAMVMFLRNIINESIIAIQSCEVHGYDD